MTDSESIVDTAVALNLRVEMTVDDLAERVAETLSHDQVLPFVKRLDELFEDWDVTLALFAFFEAQRELYDAENDLHADIAGSFIEVERPDDGYNTFNGQY